MNSLLELVREEKFEDKPVSLRKLLQSHHAREFSLGALFASHEMTSEYIKSPRWMSSLGPIDENIGINHGVIDGCRQLTTAVCFKFIMHLVPGRGIGAFGFEFNFIIGAPEQPGERVWLAYILNCVPRCSANRAIAQMDSICRVEQRP